MVGITALVVVGNTIMEKGQKEAFYKGDLRRIIHYDYYDKGCLWK